MLEASNDGKILMARKASRRRNAIFVKGTRKVDFIQAWPARPRRYNLHTHQPWENFVGAFA
jgi:hypothetical protein